MRANSFIIGFLLFLIITFTSSKYGFSTISAPTVPVERGGAVKWKSIPEDSAYWHREPFNTKKDIKQLGGPAAKQDSPDFALQGIMKSNKHYYAIINGRTVKPGDQIDGWKIAEISRYRVTLRHEKETQIFDIYQGKINRGNR
jgi:hypothetical protein